jgi:DNA-binding LytR/AlgR family response regulator
MAWRCIVVDDEKPARERLKRLIATHADFEVVGEASDPASAIEIIDTLRPDACFLDVRMPGGDGFDVVRGIEHVPRVVFTTAYDEYAVKAFDVNSIDYLLKPFSKKRFAEALERVRQSFASSEPGKDKLLQAIEALKQEVRGNEPPATGLPVRAAAPARLTAKRGSKILVLSPAEVMWFEADETLVFARAGSGRFLVERTLTDLETLMGPTFFRSHRRYLVNLAFIREILPGDAGTYEVVMKNEDKSRVPLSRRQARKLKELIPW